MGYDFKKTLAAVGVLPKNFYAYAGKTASMVVISAQAPSTALLAEIVQTVGNKTVVQTGTCFRELNGRLVFATSQAPSAKTKEVITSVLKAHGLTPKWDLRQLTDEAMAKGGVPEGGVPVKVQEGVVPRKINEPIPPKAIPPGFVAPKPVPPNTIPPNAIPVRKVGTLPSKPPVTNTNSPQGTIPSKPPVTNSNGPQGANNPQFKKPAGFINNPRYMRTPQGPNNTNTPPVTSTNGPRFASKPPVTNTNENTTESSSTNDPRFANNANNANAPQGAGKQWVPNKSQGAGKPQGPTKPQVVTTNRQGTGQPEIKVAYKAPTKFKIVPLPMPQPKTVAERTASTLVQTTALTEAAANSPFTRGNANTAMTKLDGKRPKDFDFKQVREHNGKFKLTLEADLKKVEATLKKPLFEDKRQEAVSKQQEFTLELKAMQAVEEAWENCKKKDSDKNVAALQQACEQVVDVYEKRFTNKLDGIVDRYLALKNEPNQEEQTKRQKKELYENQGPRLIASADALLDARLRQSKDLLKELDKALSAADKDKSEANVSKVLELAAQHKKAYAEHAAIYKKIPKEHRKERPPGLKEQEAHVTLILNQAEDTLFSLKQKKLGPAPWPEGQQKEGNDLLDKGREIIARETRNKGTTFRPAGGTSDVQVIKNAQDEAKFAFKSAKGETSQMGLPKGSGAIREAVTSKVMDAVLEQTGFDFGFPKVTIANLGNQVGALIEGVKGFEVPSQDDIDKLSTEEKQEYADFQNAIPGKQLQKTICAGIVTGNFFDLKWDNVFWEGEGKNANARPFDAGASFLPKKVIEKQLYETGDGTGPVVPLLDDATGKPTKGASEKMDREIMGAMLKIDVGAMRKTMAAEVQRHASTGLDILLDNDARENTLAALEAVQGFLQARKDNPPTLAELVAHMKTVILGMYPNTNAASNTNTNTNESTTTAPSTNTNTPNTNTNTDTDESTSTTTTTSTTTATKK
jgi:hypothetical protein